MKNARLFYGILLITLAAISIFSLLEDFIYSTIIHIVNISILVFWGLYFVFKQKKDISFNENKLIIRRGSKKIKEIDLSKKERIVVSVGSLKIMFKDFSETLKYSDFNKGSIQKLKALTNI
jgi:hypothetical protein